MFKKLSDFYTEVCDKAEELCRIKITDSWDASKGANTRPPSRETHKHSMLAVLSSVRSIGGRVASTCPKAGTLLMSDAKSWEEQGIKTLAAGMGVCSDCAAAVAVSVNHIANKPCYSRLKIRIEIMSIATDINMRHCFVVVNREGPLESMRLWGDVCLVIDIWYANHYPLGVIIPYGPIYELYQPVPKSHVIQYLSSIAVRTFIMAVIREGNQPDN